MGARFYDLPEAETGIIARQRFRQGNAKAFTLSA
jgi:hypothetical protein